MKSFYPLAMSLVFVALVAGCSPVEPASTPVNQPAAPTATTPTTEENFSEGGAKTELTPITMAPFTVKATHIGELSKGHFNLYIEGGEPAAVRAWIGDEAATGVMVTKAEFEVDHHCAHLEVNTPVAAEAKLWVEVETADGASLKGSTAVQ